MTPLFASFGVFFFLSLFLHHIQPTDRCKHKHIHTLWSFFFVQKLLCLTKIILIKIYVLVVFLIRCFFNPSAFISHVSLFYLSSWVFHRFSKHHTDRIRWRGNGRSRWIQEFVDKFSLERGGCFGIEWNGMYICKIYDCLHCILWIWWSGFCERIRLRGIFLITHRNFKSHTH